MKLRIGMDARPLSTSVSGVGRLLAELLLHYPNPKNVHFVLFTHLPIHPGHQKILELPYVEVPSWNGFLSKKGGTFFNIQLPLHLEKFQLDLFWGSQQVLPLFYPKNLPAVLTFCDLVAHFYPNTMRTVARWQQKLVQRKSLNSARHILNISAQTQDDLVRVYGYPRGQTSVAYPGVDKENLLELSRTVPSKRIQSLPKDYILSVSTIEPRKNYPHLLQVYKEYRAKSKGKVRPWIIAGKAGWESPEFYSEFQKELESGDILHLENVSDAELAHLYKNAGLFWFASVYEGFGIPFVEALVFQKYCMVSDIPTFQEIGGKAISYLPTNETEPWVKAILEFDENPKKLDLDISAFDWKEFAKRHSIQFQKAMEK